MYAQQGENNKALTWLVKALDLGYDQTDYVKVDPTFTVLRKDPRFIKILEERLGNRRAPRAERPAPRRCIELSALSRSRT